jgi:lipoprotein-anchoring transpeptidase ErfK/SrfK
LLFLFPEYLPAQDEVQDEVQKDVEAETQEKIQDGAQESPTPADPLEGKTPIEQLVQLPSLPRVIPRVLQRATPGATSIYISLTKQRAWLFVDKEAAVETPISSGKRSAMTPRGDFTVVEKNPDQESNIYGDFVDRQGRVVRAGVSSEIDSAPSGTVFRATPMLYQLRLNWTGLSLHAGLLPGYPAAHGNVRLPEEIARLIYDNVQVGTPVTIGD